MKVLKEWPKDRRSEDDYPLEKWAQDGKPRLAELGVDYESKSSFISLLGRWANKNGYRARTRTHKDKEGKEIGIVFQFVVRKNGNDREEE